MTWTFLLTGAVTGATVLVASPALTCWTEALAFWPDVLACWTGAAGWEGRKILVTWLICSGRLIFAGVIGGPACARAAEASKAANMSFVFMAGCRGGLSWI